MKKRFFIAIAFLVTTVSVVAQIHLTPYVGVNSTKLDVGYDYQNGGNYPFGGIDIEGRLKPKKISTVHLSLVTGASYLSNGFYQNSLFALTGLSYYSARLTDLSTQYFQVPLVVRLNWQPFPLVEQFEVFFGAGAVSNMLLKAQLTEKSTLVIYSNDPYAPPQTTQSQDSQDITALGVKQSFFLRFELGFRFKRVQASYRLSTSMGDMYFQGLENIWNVPDAASGYISGHNAAGSTTVKHSELVIGFRIF
jgi:hypothetical protein